MWGSKQRARRKPIYGWWEADEAASSLIRSTDGADLRFMLESERPDALTRTFVFRAHLPGVTPVFVPVEAIDRSRENCGYLTWRAHLDSAQFEGGAPLLHDERCLAFEWFLFDALSAWPDQMRAGMKPGLIELRGGRVNGTPLEERWRQFHSCVSSDDRPRWPSRGFPPPTDDRWEFHVAEGRLALPDVPDFRTLSRTEILAWVDERLRNAPRLICGARVLFPLCREWQTALRWVYCDPDIIFDRLVSSGGWLQSSSNWTWSCHRESLVGTRQATTGSLFDYPGSGRDGAPFPRKGLAQGWEESPYLPALLSQRIAESIGPASYALTETTFSAADRQSGERVDLRIVPPVDLKHSFGFTGGVLNVSMSEGLTGGPVTPPPAPRRPMFGRMRAPRFALDAAKGEIRDLATSRKLAFERSLDGSSLAETDQRFVLRYSDEALEWPFYVCRQARGSGFRVKPWLVDARPAKGAVVPDETTFTGIMDFVAVALNGWPDDERSGPAPQSTRILGGYLNGSWREDYGVEASGPDPTRQELDDAWLDPDMQSPTTRWTKLVNGFAGELPPDAPKPGSIRRAGNLAGWVAEHARGIVLRAEGAVFASVGSVTTHGHGGGTTVHWEYEDALVWLRMSASRWGWRIYAGGPVEGADPAAFDRSVTWDSPTKTYHTRPQMELTLRRARLGLLDRPSTIELSWLPIDGALMPGTVRHFLEGSPPVRAWP